jgi:hypothetical protein
MIAILRPVIELRNEMLTLNLESSIAKLILVRSCHVLTDLLLDLLIRISSSLPLFEPSACRGVDRCTISLVELGHRKEKHRSSVA